MTFVVTNSKGSIDLNQVDVSRGRSEEHTSELQSRPHISYAVFCLKKKKQKNKKKIKLLPTK